MSLSLCIPTIDRWEFLSVNLPKYLTNPYINEIIITDENGNDATKIREHFNDPKIKVYINEKRLGPFFNKRRAISHATNAFICLMDSDNFAPLSYFEAFYNFLEGKTPDEDTLYTPSYTLPTSNHTGFNFTMHNGTIIDKSNYKLEYKKDNIVFNVGNYISSKSIHEKLILNDEELEAANNSWAVDVLYNNYLLLTKVNAKIITVPNMAYSHIVHDGSMYIQTHRKVNLRFYESKYE
jgi:glycosyltransferase involved in cell wall biosynthesis